MATLESIEGQLKEVLEILKKKGTDALGAFTMPASAPAPEPIPQGSIIYPVDGATVIARIPMGFVYEGDGSPKWFSSVDGDLKVDGGQVAPVLKSTGEHTIEARVGKYIVDEVRVIAIEPPKK